MYQYQFAPVPNAPPLTLKVVDEPLQIEAGNAVAEVAATDKELTVIVTLTHVVVLQRPAALTQ